MNDNVKWGILIILLLVCLIILLIGFYNVFTTNMENSNKKQLAIVTFSPDKSSSVIITCEVASSPEKRLIGLMFREELPVDEGMLFLYESPRNVSYWMKNVLIPLDIIFLDENCTIIYFEKAEIEANVSDDKLKRYHSTSPAKWVVEINQNLCYSYGIEKGMEVLIEYL